MAIHDLRLQIDFYPDAWHEYGPSVQKSAASAFHSLLFARMP
jgi:hypothetical protein